MFSRHELRCGDVASAALMGEVNSVQQQDDTCRKSVELKRALTNNQWKARMILTHGAEAAQAKIDKMKDDVDLVYQDTLNRFTNMIQAIYDYMAHKNMHLEYFQLELLRGVVVGLMYNQFGDNVFKAMFPVLYKLGLAPDGLNACDPLLVDQHMVLELEANYNKYAKPYTLGLVPRQCGKSLIMKLILASVIVHLDITTMVQAQNKNMSKTLFNSVEEMIGELTCLPGYPQENVPLKSSFGTPDNKTYRFNRAFKGDSTVHFLASSADVSMTLPHTKHPSTRLVNP